MAFGQTAKQEAVKREKTTEENDTPKAAWPYIPLRGGHKKTVKGGIRKVRFLPKIENGMLVEVPRLNRAGKPIPGQMVGVTAEEVRFVEIWWEFMSKGETKKKRIWVDWRDGRWNNPFWELAKGTDKGSPERQAMKEQFVINVIDKTPVIIDENGYPVYTDETGAYVITALGTRLDKAVEGTPEPLNQVRIIQGTSGRTTPPGKHFFQQFYNLIGTFEDGDGIVRDLHEFDLMIKISGADVETTRAVTPQPNFKPLPDSLIFAPRYDLETWAKPWPNAAIEELLSGRDYEEVAANYGVVLNPQLKPVDHPSHVNAPEDDVPFDNSVPATPEKRSRSRKKVEEESEELFED